MRGLFRAVLCCLAVLAVTPAGAAEKLRVVKAVAFAWTFTPLDVGIQMGLFAKHGLDVEASAAAGDAKLQQALAADSADIGIGSGPGMAFMAKGVPAKAVGVMYGVPKNMAVMVAYNSPIKTVDDLKGKKLGCTTVGSLTHWIGDRINQVKGWGSSGITMVPIGGMPPARAAMKTNQIDGYIGALETGYALEEQKEWRVITSADAVRRAVHHARVLRARRADPEASRGGAGVPQRLDGHHRLHEGQQGQDGRDHLQGDQRAAVGGRARL